jgi:hypothetical protein
MKNKMIYKTVFILSALILSSHLYSKDKINKDCHKYMREVILLSKMFKVESTIKSKLNRMVRNDKLNQYLQNQWLTHVKKNKNITPNAMYQEQGKLVKECVQFVKG